MFEQYPDVTVELERIIPARDVVIPYVWVRGTVVDVESAFTDHPGVEEIRFVDAVDDESLLRVEWAIEYTGILQTLTDADIALIKATGTSRRWTFEIRGDDRRAIATFQDRCRELDVPITVAELHALTPAAEPTTFSSGRSWMPRPPDPLLKNGFSIQKLDSTAPTVTYPVMSVDATDFETVLELYRDEHRRAVLAVFLDERRPLTVTDLARTVVKYTHQGSVPEASSEALERIQRSLHHCHLPKLAAADLVEYDSERRIVEPTAQFDRVQPHLLALVEADPELETPLEL